MVKLMLGLPIGLFIGLLLEQFLPVEWILIAGIILIVLVILFFLIFHFGVRDFQGY
ncbi:MAG: hypothetical protein ACOYZ8_06665 [Chloroflexota bacterium]